MFRSLIHHFLAKVW